MDVCGHLYLFLLTEIVLSSHLVEFATSFKKSTHSCQYVNGVCILHTMTLEIQTRSKKTRHNQKALIEQALEH